MKKFEKILMSPQIYTIINNMENPDPQTSAEKINFWLSQSTIEDPQAAQTEVLASLKAGGLSRADFVSIALSALAKIGLPIPAGIAIMDATLKLPDLSEGEAETLLRVLSQTSSSQNYSEGLAILLQKHPSLDGVYEL